MVMCMVCVSMSSVLKSLLLTSCIILDTLLNLARINFPHLQNRVHVTEKFAVLHKRKHVNYHSVQHVLGT